MAKTLTAAASAAGVGKIQPDLFFLATANFADAATMPTKPDVNIAAKTKLLTLFFTDFLITYSRCKRVF
jgi:hypothetical protein